MSKLFAQIINHIKNKYCIEYLPQNRFPHQPLASILVEEIELLFCVLFLLPPTPPIRLIIPSTSYHLLSTQLDCNTHTYSRIKLFNWLHFRVLFLPHITRHFFNKDNTTFIQTQHQIYILNY